MPHRKNASSGTVDELRHIALFARMDNADLARVAELGEPVDAQAGGIIIDQGDVGRECFLILEGEAGIFNAGEHIASVGAGAIVGEMALIDHRPRNASVIAQNDMRLLSFDIAVFKHLLEDMPKARDHIFGLLEARKR
jgi:CRP-like cAMP-binding protein